MKLRSRLLTALNPTQVHDRCFQARYTQGCELIGILAEGCALAGAGETLDQAIGIQVQTGPASTLVGQVALIELREVAGAGNALIVRRDAMATEGVNQRGTPGSVVDLAIAAFGVATDSVACGPMKPLQGRRES